MTGPNLYHDKTFNSVEIKLCFGIVNDQLKVTRCHHKTLDTDRKTQFLTRSHFVTTPGNSPLEQAALLEQK